MRLYRRGHFQPDGATVALGLLLHTLLVILVCSLGQACT